MNTHHSINLYYGVKVKLCVLVVAELKGYERLGLLSGSFLGETVLNINDIGGLVAGLWLVDCGRNV